MKTFAKKIVKKFMTTHIVKLYLVMLGINFGWILTSGMIFLLCGFTFSQHVASTSMFKNSLFLVPMAAFMEEIAFRWLPMLIVVGIVTVVTKIAGKPKSRLQLVRIQKRWMTIVLVIIAIVFGYLHGNLCNVFMQGVSALIISAFYLRAYFRSDPTKRITKSQLIPLFSVTVFHAMVNMVMIF